MPFITGQSGNPDGCKRAKPFTDALKQELSKAWDDKQPNYKKIHKIAEKVVAMALEGNMAAVQEVTNRLEGKPPQENINKNINENGEGVLNLNDLVGIIARIAGARGFALPESVKRLEQEEAGNLPPILEAKIIS